MRLAVVIQTLNVKMFHGKLLSWLILFAFGTIVINGGPTKSQRGPMVFQDEFDSLNKGNWKHLITGWRGGNNEFQYYTNRTENRYVNVKEYKDIFFQW